MKKSTSLIVLLTGCFFFFQSAAFSQAKPVQQSNVEVIQFHLEHRCYSCNKMEEYSIESLKSYPGIPFRLYNVEDKKNQKLAEKFKASGTSLYLYNPRTGKIKDLTAAAFLSVGDKDRFIRDLKKNIDDFKKSF